jgi:glycosyltransferase involved in cell wall biosynthesis
LKSVSPKIVKYTPVIPRNRIAEYYRSASILVGQMKLGEFGMTELEATASGLAVTTFLHNRETPFIPKEDTPQALASALDELVDDKKKRTTYAKKCLEYVIKNHDAKKIARTFSKTIENVDSCWHGEHMDFAEIGFGSAFELSQRIVGKNAAASLRQRLLGL